MATPEPAPVNNEGSGAIVATEWCPIYKWGQLKRKVVLTIFVPCLDEGNVKTTVRSAGLSFRAERVAALAGGEESRRGYSLSLALGHASDEDQRKADPRPVPRRAHRGTRTHGGRARARACDV